MNKSIKIFLWIIFFIVSFVSLIYIENLRIQSKIPVNLFMDKYSFLFWENFVSVEGTLVEQNSNYYDKLNTVHVECRKSTKECIQSYGGLFEGGFSDRPYLRVKTDVYPIHRWDKDILIYKDFSKCYETTFTITRETEKLTGVTNFLSNKSECKDEKNKKVTYELVDGFEYQMEMEKQIRSVFLNTFIFLILLGVTIFGIYKTVRKKST